MQDKSMKFNPLRKEHAATPAPADTGAAGTLGMKPAVKIVERPSNFLGRDTTQFYAEPVASTGDTPQPQDDEDYHETSTVGMEKLAANMNAKLNKENGMEFNFEQAKMLLEMFGGEEAHITVAQDGETLKAYHTDYPEEGSIELYAGEEKEK